MPRQRGSDSYVREMSRPEWDGNRKRRRENAHRPCQCARPRLTVAVHDATVCASCLRPVRPEATAA